MRDSHEPELATSRFAWGLPSAIVLLGLALRLYHLTHQSLRGDEIFSVALSGRPLKEMIPYLVKDFVQPPLHYFLLHFWFKLVGFGPYQARLLSVVFGTSAILAIYLLGKYLFGRAAASLAALLLAMSQLAVMYSQDARPYALFLFLVPCCIHLFLVALRSGRAGPWWGFVCAAILVVYTQYYGFFAVAALLLFALLYRRRYRVAVSRWVGGVALGLALYLPWLSSGIVSEWLHSSKVPLGHRAPGVVVHWWVFLTTVNEFNNGRAAGLAESAPWWTFLLGGLLFSMPALIALKPLVQNCPADPSQRRVRENLSILFILCVIPVLAGFGLLLADAYNIRYVIFVCVPYYLLVARGMSILDSTWLRTTLVIAWLAYGGTSLRANYFVPYIEDYRGAYAYLAQARKPDDCYVVPHSWLQHDAPWGWSVYHQSQAEMSLTTLDAIASGQKNCPRVWLMTISRSDPFPMRESREARKMLEQDHLRVEERHFFWLDVDLYVRKSR